MAAALAGGLLMRPTKAAVWGFMGGLTLDLMGPGPLGLSALLMAAATAGVGIGRSYLERGNLVFSLFILMVASTGYNLGLMLAWSILDAPLVGRAGLASLLLPATLWNGLALAALLPIVFRLAPLADAEVAG